MNMNDVAVIILGMLFVAVVGVATFLALDGLDDNLTANSEGFNATRSITQGVGNIFDLAPTWGTLIGVGVLIGIITGFLFLGAVGYSYGRQRGYF